MTVTVGGKPFIDIMGKGVNKGTALSWLGDYLQVTPDHMMVFGDTYNDIEMLKLAKYSYLVDNALSEMDQYANFRTASNRDHGVMGVIDHVLDDRQPLISRPLHA